MELQTYMVAVVYKVNVLLFISLYVGSVSTHSNQPIINIKLKIMRTTTYYYNADGQQIKTHSGEPRNASVFERNSADAVRIFIGSNVFKKVNGHWIGELYRNSNGYQREVLERKQTQIHRVIEQVSEQYALSLIEAEAASLMTDARNAIRWCRQEDENDPDGRYWLNAYAGAEVYRLIVQNGRIVGSIPGGYHNSRPLDSSVEAWKHALEAAIAEKVTGEYRLLKADGSGTYFYLRNHDDAQYLSVNEYDVPSVHGGTHHNVEVK